jgi:hypothetical protein
LSGYAVVFTGFHKRLGIFEYFPRHFRVEWNGKYEAVDTPDSQLFTGEQVVLESKPAL